MRAMTQIGSWFGSRASVCRALFFSSSLSFASLLGACDGTGGGDDADGGELPDGGQLVHDGGQGGDGGADGGVLSQAPEALIRAICEWEFRCCSRGELDFRMGPFTSDVNSCVERFTFELRESNSTSNPFVSGSAAALLGNLAYHADLANVEVNEAGMAACTSSWTTRACNAPVEATNRCAGPNLVGSDPCSFRNLFKPKLEQGEACDVLLTESISGNDVECVPGTTCVGGGGFENAGEDPTCVTRRVVGEFCTRDNECDFDIYCNNAGRCEEKGDPGEACVFRNPARPSSSDLEVPCKQGLSCHPTELVCKANCSEGFTCGDDGQCPAGLACIPLQLPNGGGTFATCRAPAEDGPCNSAADCLAAQSCNSLGVASTCVDKPGLNATCSFLSGACQPGLYCSNTSGTCVAYTALGQACVFAAECDPATATAGCVFNPTAAAAQCAAQKNALAARCQVASDCASGLCEITTSGSNAICTAGVGVGASCDNSTSDPLAPACAPGLSCDAGKCVARLDPGAICRDPDSGLPSSSLCKNSLCQVQWEVPMCSDAPVAKTLGGSGVTCDGP
jgi:hypothetical protein